MPSSQPETEQNGMTESSNIEYCFLRYVPKVDSDMGVDIAVIFIDATDLENGICTVRVAADWQTKVRSIDQEGDLEMLSALLTEISDRLLSESERADMIHQLEDSFSNSVRVSQRRKCPVARRPGAIEAFARGLFSETSPPSSRSSNI
jgi:hypothetical protein